jgi:AcrR family transcriptional regulator
MRPMGRKKLLPNRGSLILDAASLLFAQTSYEKTTLDEIAQQAGVSKGSIYLEFPSKEEILYHLIQRNKDTELAEMRRLAARKSEHPLELLKTILVQNMGAIFDSIQQKQLSMEELMQTRKHLHSRLKPFIEARLALIEELLLRAEQAGEIQPLNDHRRRTAQLIMLTMRGVLPPYREETSRMRLQHDTAELLELIINGLR